MLIWYHMPTLLWWVHKWYLFLFRNKWSVCASCVVVDKQVVVSVCTMGCGAILSLYLNSKWSWMPLVKLIVSGKTQPESGLHNMCEHGAGRGLSPTGSQRNSQVALRMSHICATSLLHCLLLSTLTQLPVLHDMAAHWSITLPPILASGKEHYGLFRAQPNLPLNSQAHQVLSWNELCVMEHGEMYYSQNKPIIELDVAPLRPQGYSKVYEKDISLLCMTGNSSGLWF